MERAYTKMLVVNFFGLWDYVFFFSLCFSIFPKIAGSSVFLFKMKGHFSLMNVLLIVM